MNDSEEKIRIYLFHSPKFSTRRIRSDQQITSQSTRIKKPTTKIYPQDETVFAQLAFLKDFDCQIFAFDYGDVCLAKQAELFTYKLTVQFQNLEPLTFLVLFPV